MFFFVRDLPAVHPTPVAYRACAEVNVKRPLKRQWVLCLWKKHEIEDKRRE